MLFDDVVYPDEMFNMVLVCLMTNRLIYIVGFGHYMCQIVQVPDGVSC